MEIVLIIFILCLIKLSKRNTSFTEQRQVHYNLLTTFDTFGMLNFKNRATSNIFDNSFSNKIPKSFINRKQALVDDILMRQLPNHDLLFILVMIL
jgi:hypothetical protein